MACCDAMTEDLGLPVYHEDRVVARLRDNPSLHYVRTGAWFREIRYCPFCGAWLAGLAVEAKGASA